MVTAVVHVWIHPEVHEDRKLMGMLDALNRLPLPVAPAKTETPPELVLPMEHLEEPPVTDDHIWVWTRKDPPLSSVVQFLHQAMQSSLELHPYWSKKLELSLHQGCILWGSRVVVPVQGREAVCKSSMKGTWGWQRWKHLPACMCGGQAWRRTSRQQWGHLQSINQFVLPH